jgi:hypothetical protein
MVPFVEYRRAMAASQRYEALKRDGEMIARRGDVPRRIFDEFYSDAMILEVCRRGLYETSIMRAARTIGQQTGLVRAA